MSEKALTYTALVLWALMVLFPLLDALNLSKATAPTTRSTYRRSLPCLPTLENYKAAFTAVPLGRYLLNTLVFTVLTTAIMAAVSILAAYAFARLEFKGKNLVFLLFLSLMMIPNELVVITNFATITGLDLQKKHLRRSDPAVGNVRLFYIYLLKENFEQVPDELYKAARVDGTSDFKYLWKVPDPHLPPYHRHHYHFKDH